MNEALENIINRVKDYQQEARFATEDDELGKDPVARKRLLDPLLNDLREMERMLDKFWEKFDGQFPAI